MSVLSPNFTSPGPADHKRVFSFYCRSRHGTQPHYIWPILQPKSMIIVSISRKTKGGNESELHTVTGQNYYHEKHI